MSNDEQRDSADSNSQAEEHANTHLSIKQCDPGFSDYRLYTFMQGSTQIAEMIVPRVRDPQGRYSVGTEYWFMGSMPQSTATTTVSWVDRTWSTTPPSGQSFTMVQNATWTNQPPSLSNGPLLTNSDDSIGIQWKLTLSSGVWGGSIIWSRTTPRAGSNPNNLFAGPPGSQTFNEATRVPSSLTYNANVPAVR